MVWRLRRLFNEAKSKPSPQRAYQVPLYADRIGRLKYSEDLIRHAIRLLGNTAKSESGTADLRRAVSAAYYGLFHHLSEAAVQQIAPQVSLETANRIHRWLDHQEIKRICIEFAKIHLNHPLRDLLGDSSSVAMQTVAVAFIQLQEARHSADYDMGYQLNWEDARQLIAVAAKAITAWDRLAPSAESNIFVLSLFLWKKWDVVRP